MKKVGIALGGGGVRGFAHVAMLEVIDELEVTPYCLAGTSMGAMIGALYASGLSAGQITKDLSKVVASEKASNRISLTKFVKQMMELADLSLGHGGLFKGEKIVNSLIERMDHVTTFEELKIPLKIVAADFWRREEVVFDSGELGPAIRASMAFPVIFAPVRHQGRLLVDGGTVNPVPYDLLARECDITIAIDVMGVRSKHGAESPSLNETLANVFQIAQQSILTERRKRIEPDIYIRPEIEDIETMEFHKIMSVREQAMAAQKQLREELERLLSRRWWSLR